MSIQNVAKDHLVSERDVLVEALVAEVLGPRRGPTEVMSAEEDPLDEYIIGVLSPAKTVSEPELDAADELGGDGGAGADDDEGAESSVVTLPTTGTGLPSLNLDPMTRPSSMGISMAIEAEGPPVIDICVTWARYTDDSATGSWRRQPYGQIWRSVKCGSKSLTLTPDSDPAVSVRVRSRHDHQGTWQVSLFLVNDTQSEQRRPRSQEHVFQPQIRILCREGTIVPVERQRPSRDPEEESLDLLYQDRPTLARGHLCSALWRAVDPERPHPQGHRGRGAPFVWTDGQHLFDKSAFEEFSPADVRSEYVPVIPVNAPSSEWPTDAGTSPERDPIKLSEITDGNALRRALIPLADSYERWVNSLPATPGVAAAHVERCRQALTRIRDGIDLLQSDEDTRLAFGFANRAIALQSEWGKGRVNPWRPFQLAFILLNLRAMVDEAHPDRDICDLLWFPTGGGKTEAYLGLAAFTLGYRRLRARREGSACGGAGVTVLSRYTLRLLTIQQYRRALTLVTACEYLRVHGQTGRRGWRPEGSAQRDDLLWGEQRFSIGLWVGGSVTPNNLLDFTYRDANGKPQVVHGAISILQGKRGDGDPAQILNCPACRAPLALPSEGLRGNDRPITLHVVMSDVARLKVLPEDLSQDPIRVSTVNVAPHTGSNYATVSITLSADRDVAAEKVEAWFVEHVRRKFGPHAELAPVRATRPGYFIREVDWGVGRRARPKAVDFEIFCPNDDCVLNQDMTWSERTPAGAWDVPEAFRNAAGDAVRCPIPAYTVDEQVYARTPSVVVATVDKFARLAYEPRAGSLFGNVDRYNEHLGYFRSWSAPGGPDGLPNKPREVPSSGQSPAVSGLRPPALILQDELHLIEGPLGSMVGLYETGIDLLATEARGSTPVRPKYVASTATVRQAQEQVESLYARDLAVFPPPGVSADDSFFSRTAPSHPLDTEQPGRLYVGIVAPGRGAQTPLVRTWSRLLQTPYEQLEAGSKERDVDPFWTLVGYFNAIRELAGAVALVRQDIQQRLSSVADAPREIVEADPMELSSRADSLSLPMMLDDLGSKLGDPRTPVNVVVSTSMFGTGVDVDRLGLMFVNGQPKTTSAYIQATGRVGRSGGGLVVTFYRSTRPRDLSHYEYFAGYHTTLYRHVEPVTVNPFAPRARDRALGPVTVSILRQARFLPTADGVVPVNERWRIQQRLVNGWYCCASAMDQERTSADVESVPALLEQRANRQPEQRRPAPGETAGHAGAQLDVWKEVAATYGNSLLYFEGTVTRTASMPVVLGDLAHEVARTGEAFKNAPNSLREVESTVTISGRK
ncbi:DISARM system helicase DrmA [Microbispora sp. CSR-4]|uniref:DISARM system helicase DrmA n=1 Tax=Microbispora sp. CSR-4 TaxID=2592813 RepID=UPI0011CAA8D6|nr:DISARM system helicase DrmA [Microbispora sp. CSR-4]